MTREERIARINSLETAAEAIRTVYPKHVGTYYFHAGEVIDELVNELNVPIDDIADAIALSIDNIPDHWDARISPRSYHWAAERRPDMRCDLRIAQIHSCYLNALCEDVQQRL